MRFFSVMLYWCEHDARWFFLGLACMALAVPALPPGVAAQSRSSVSSPPPDSSDSWIPPLASFRKNALDVFSGPIPRTPRERRMAAGTMGLLLAVVATLDEPAYQNVSPRSQGMPSETLSRTAASLARPGNWYARRNADQFAARTVGGLALSGLVLQRPAITRTAIRTLESILYTDAIVGLIKSVLNRNRPYVGREPDPFATTPGLFSPAHTKLSMPSGHVGRVFSIATVLAHQAGRWYVSVPLYAGAASVSVERVRGGHHWVSDVVAGGIIGFLVGRSVVDRSPGSGGTPRFMPVLSDGSIGIAVRL